MDIPNPILVPRWFLAIRAIAKQSPSVSGAAFALYFWATNNAQQGVVDYPGHSKFAETTGWDRHLFHKAATWPENKGFLRFEKIDHLHTK